MPARNDLAKDYQFKTAAEFVAHFRDNEFLQTRDIFDATGSGRNGFLFRGHANASWRLAPSAFRDNALFNFTPQPPGPRPSTSNPTDLSRWIGMHLHAELRSVFIFMEAADRLGIPTPINYRNVREHDNLLVSMLGGSPPTTTEPFPAASTLDELALAQHHGVPTRLLDWTESPFIAAFFAAHAESDAKEMAVFTLRTHELRKARDEVAIVSAPRHGNSFLRSQQGLFIHMPRANRYLLDNGRWPDLEDIIANQFPSDPKIGKTTLPRSEADSLLRILYDMNISPASMQPSLRSAAESFQYIRKIFPSR